MDRMGRTSDWLTLHNSRRPNVVWIDNAAFQPQKGAATASSPTGSPPPATASPLPEIDLDRLEA